MKLLLDGKALEIGNTAIALTFQANDITKPDSIQSNYSNTFALPDTPYNRLLLGFANLVNAVTDSPYKKLDVQVFSSGREVVPYGKGQLVEHVEDERFDLQVLSGNRDLFAEIEGKSIRDLDLSAYNHQWTSGAVIGSASHNYTNGYIYDIVNRGIENQNIESKWTYFLPSTFARIIWDAIFSEAGFSYEWPEMPEVFNSFIITPGQPFGYGEKFIKARSSKASRFPSVDIERNHSNASGAPLKEWIIFDDDSSDNSVYDGEQNNYNPTTGWYTADTYMYVNVTFQLRFDLRVVNGKVKAKVFLGINGDGALYNTEQFFGNGIFSQNYPNQVFTHTFERVLLSPGDTLQLYVEITDDSTIFDYEVKLYLDKPGTFMQVDVLEEFPPLGQVVLADWLPDMSQKDFLKAFKKLFDLTFQPDLHLDLIKIGGFSGLITGISSAVDLTSRVNMLSKPSHRYLYDSFAKVNHFKWKAESNESDAPRSTSATLAKLKDVNPLSLTYNAYKTPGDYAGDLFDFATDATLCPIEIINMEPNWQPVLSTIKCLQDEPRTSAQRVAKVIDMNPDSPYYNQYGIGVEATVGTSDINAATFYYYDTNASACPIYVSPDPGEIDAFAAEYNYGVSPNRVKIKVRRISGNNAVEVTGKVIIETVGTEIPQGNALNFFLGAGAEYYTIETSFGVDLAGDYQVKVSEVNTLDFAPGAAVIALMKVTEFTF